MKKFLLILVATLGLLSSISAQTATNFSCNDCSGNYHDLFTELDAGKVIVLVWVMPCSACSGPTLTTYNVVSSYQASYPNRVYMYLADDYANTACSSLNSWANSNNVPQNVFSLRFSNTAVDMTDYGTTGMPKIVVVGGTSHNIYFNVVNSVNPTQLQNAIDAALGSTGINDKDNLLNEINVIPNPVLNNARLKFELWESANVKIKLYDLQGHKLHEVFLGQKSAGVHTFDFDCSNLAAGTYLVKLDANGNERNINFIVSH